MSKALLLVPHFWDPVCVPLGVSSLCAHARRAGHEVSLFDFNTIPEVFEAQRQYFNEVKRQLPAWRRWNIERNGTEMLAMHQMLYLHARARPDYRELVAEVLSMAGDSPEQVAAMIDTAAFDTVFARLYARVTTVLERLMASARPNVVGCSLFNSTWPATLFLLRRAKALWPSVRTVVGGPGPIMGIASSDAEVTGFHQAHDFVDYYVLGEGERSFVHILEHPDLPPGVIGVRSGTSPGTSLSMSELPDPDYGDLDTSGYVQLSVSSSRGCPFACSFCAETVFWDGFRRTDSEATAAQMRRLASRYSNSSFYLCDSLANPVIDGMAKSFLRNGDRLQFDAYLRPDKSCTNVEKTSRWHDAGLYRARLGMESASQRILDDMVKMTTTATMSKALDALAQGGVRTSTLWIVGYPNETDSEFDDTLAFIGEYRRQIYDADAWLFQYHPSGLAGSDKIEGRSGSRHRFSEALRTALGIDARIVDDGISAAERCDRLARFVARMEEWDIPNPYSLSEWRRADRRWSDLCPRSRPGLGTV